MLVRKKQRFARNAFLEYFHDDIISVYLFQGSFHGTGAHLTKEAKMEMTKIVKVYSTFDESILISMLQSADIDVVSDSTNFQRVQYGTIFSTLTGTVISVNAEFLEEARIIIKEYIDNKKNNQTDPARFSISSFQEMPELLVE